MRRLLFGLAVLGGLAAVAPASAAVLHPAAVVVAGRSPIVEAYWERHHWVPPHHRWWRHHRWEYR